MDLSGLIKFTMGICLNEYIGYYGVDFLFNIFNFFKKIYKYIETRIYINETLIVFAHKYEQNIHSEAVVQYATYNNLIDILDFQPKHYLEVFKKFLNCGDKGYFAYLNDKCVHRSWTKTACQTVYLHRFLPMELKEYDVFIHWCETAEFARGKNVYPYVLSQIVKDFTNAKRIMISVNEDNNSSIRGILKAGFIPIERHKILVVCGMKFKKKSTIY